MEKEIERRYFSITEVSEKVGEPASQIRYWTSYYKIIPHRPVRMRKRYTWDDVLIFKKIKLITDTRCFTMEGVKQILSGKLKFKQYADPPKEITPDSIFENDGRLSKVNWKKDL